MCINIHILLVVLALVLRNTENNFQINFKDTLKVFHDFKNEQKVYKVMFFDIWKYIYSESLFTQILKKFPLDKKNVTKDVLFFLSQIPTHHSLLLICNSHMSRSTKFVSLKACLKFSISDSDSVSFLLNFIYFCSWTLWL